MDLLKARKRALEKAREEEKKRSGREEAEVKSSAEKGPAPVVERKPELPPAPAAESANMSPPVAPKSKKKGPKKKAAPAAEPKKPAPPPEEGKAETAPAPPPEDVFTDDAFGEDIPSLGEVEDLACDLLGDTAPAGSAATPLLEEESEEVCAEGSPEEAGGDEDLSFEVKAADARPVSTPRAAAKSPPPPAPEKTATPAAPARVSPPPPETPRFQSAAPSPAAAPKLDLEFTGAESWSLDRLADKDDDFFSLVTEDLYMREFGRPQEEEGGQQLELLSFRLASETYAVHLTSIKQIIRMIPITTVPRAPAHVLGIISLRGTIIPIFDLRKVLHLPAAQANRKTRIVIVAEGKFVTGLIVDEVEQVVRMSPTKIEPPPPVLAGVEADYIEGIGRVGPKMIIMLSLSKVMVPVNQPKAGG